MTPFKASLVTTMLVFPLNLAAESVNQAANTMCQHMKVCIQGNLDAENDIPPEMRQMLDTMISNMCTSVVDVSTAMVQKDVEVSAIACLNSVTKLSCSQLENEIQTAECSEYERQLKKHYPSNR